MSDHSRPVAKGGERNTNAVSPDTPFSGENTRRRCDDSGQLGSEACPDCGGAGKVTTPVGGAG
jgi:hypothetical protein